MVFVILKPLHHIQTPAQLEQSKQRILTNYVRQWKSLFDYNQVSQNASFVHHTVSTQVWSEFAKKVKLIDNKLANPSKLLFFVYSSEQL